MGLGIGKEGRAIPCVEEVWKEYLLMGSEAETGVGLHIIEQKKSREHCRGHRVPFSLLPRQAAWASLPSTPSSLLAQPSPVCRVAQEQVARGKAQDEEDLLQDHLPAQVTHQIPLET